MIEFVDVKKGFFEGTPDEITVFESLNLKVEKGEFVSIVGSNGSGKTTLLNLVCGTYTPDSGKILVAGKDITKMSEYKRAKKIGRVFQDTKKGSAPGLTILENMALADNKNHRYSLTPAISKKRIDYFRELLSRCEMGLENRLDVKVGALSGGQRQALALVLANMSDIEVLILDEHTAALDPKSSEIIMNLTDKLIAEKKITTLMVTHNLRHAASFGTRLLMMDKGRIVLDVSEKEKQETTVDKVLSLFNSISIECGN